LAARLVADGTNGRQTDRTDGTQMIKQLTGVVAACVATLIFTAGLGVATTDVRPYCPTEDSCAVDYADGRWTVRPVVP